eukprot:9491828-Pyramimonas_sp.AAC.1
MIKSSAASRPCLGPVPGAILYSQTGYGGFRHAARSSRESSLPSSTRTWSPPMTAPQQPARSSLARPPALWTCRFTLVSRLGSSARISW